MKRILLPLSLLLLLALAAGCSAQGEAQLDPTMAQQLQIDETMAATLAPGIQDVDVTDRGTDLTLHVRQTLGNDRELYVLYDVTLAGTVALPAGEEGWFGPQTVTLQGVAGGAPPPAAASNPSSWTRRGRPSPTSPTSPGTLPGRRGTCACPWGLCQR